MENEKRLIDANALLEVLKEKHDWVMQDPEVSPTIKWGEAVCNYRVREAIERVPTVDAVEVVRGRWKKHGKHDWCCSVCKVGVPYSFTGHSYCHNCGAKMDGERKDND